ncbi:hypothetical protein Tco_0184072 [Tanacetum coccineum]
MRIEEETRTCPAQNNESGQLESQKAALLPLVKKESLPPPLIKVFHYSSRSDTDEELREFTSEYYISSALHSIVPAASASIADFPVGKVGVYTRFFEFAINVYPLRVYVQRALNHYRPSFFTIALIHNQALAKKPNLEVNCRLLADYPNGSIYSEPFYTPLVKRFHGYRLSQASGALAVLYPKKLDALRRWREMFFWVDDALVPWDFAFYTQGSLPRDERPPPGGGYQHPYAGCASATVEPPRPDTTSVGSSEDADVAEVDSGLKRKRATGDDGAGPSKRVRHVSLGLSTSTEEETPDASPTLAAKEVTETPPPMSRLTSVFLCAGDDMLRSPTPRLRTKAFEARVYRRLDEILMLKTQVGQHEQDEAESSRSIMHRNSAEEKMALACQVESMKRADCSPKSRGGGWRMRREVALNSSIEWRSSSLWGMLCSVALAVVRRKRLAEFMKRLLKVPCPFSTSSPVRMDRARQTWDCATKDSELLGCLRRWSSGADTKLESEQSRLSKRLVLYVWVDITITCGVPRIPYQEVKVLTPNLLTFFCTAYAFAAHPSWNAH